MPNWSEILEEIREAPTKLANVRQKYMQKLHVHTGRNIIAYYSAFLSKKRAEGIEINHDDLNGFMQSVHGLPHEKGLDLILHTPGGEISATEKLVRYLRDIFGNNIRAIIPQIAMSAGTLLACACKEIIMGKQSSLGPTDPQIYGYPAYAIKEQFLRAYKDIVKNPSSAPAWAPIIQSMIPTLLIESEFSLERSRDLLKIC